MITQKQYTEPSRKRRTGLCLPPLENCQKICCKKQRGMLKKSKHRTSSCKKSIAQWESFYVSTYSDDFKTKLAPIRMKVVIAKETDSHLSIGGLVPKEPALLRHIHFQSNYNNMYQGRDRDTKTMNTIVEEIEEDNGKEAENSQRGGGKKKGEKEKESRYSLLKEFDTAKTQPRILSIFQQDYQVPYLTENLKPPSKRRPVDCYKPLPLVSQGYAMETSYDRDYGRIKLPELEFVSPNGKQRDNNKVQFKNSYCI